MLGDEAKAITEVIQLIISYNMDIGFGKYGVLQSVPRGKPTTYLALPV